MFPHINDMRGEIYQTVTPENSEIYDNLYPFVSYVWPSNREGNALKSLPLPETICGLLGYWKLLEVIKETHSFNRRINRMFWKLYKKILIQERSIPHSTFAHIVVYTEIASFHIAWFNNCSTFSSFSSLIIFMVCKSCTNIWKANLHDLYIALVGRS